MQPLNGIRVLDFTRVLAGPYCTMLMADMGADVIKVESLRGDSTRSWTGADGAAVAFQNVNRGKRGVSLDLRSPEGRRIARELARDSDVLIENFRPGTMEAMGLSYETVADENPSVVYCSISGYGQTGPDSQRGGYDLMAQAASGIMSITGPDGGGEAMKCGVPVADLAAGLFALINILGALRPAKQHGVGRHVDVSLVESAAALTVWETAEYWLTGAAPEPTGSAHRLAAPYQAFRTADRDIVLAANTDRQYGALCEILDLEDLVADARFQSIAERTRNRRELAQILQEKMLEQPAAEWLAVFADANIPASEIRSIPDMLVDPHLASRGIAGVLSDSDGDHIPYLSTPVTRQFASEVRMTAAPRLGQHSRGVLAESLGVDDSTLNRLIASGVVRATEGSQ